jgi:uncharacterized membrane protein
VIIALAVCYPLLAHLAVVTGSQWLTAASLIVLAAIALLPGLRRGRARAWLAAAALVVALGLLARWQLVWLPLYAPSVLADFLVAFIFGRTLVAGRTPLIERIVRLLHAPEEQLDPGVLAYARRLTLAWALLFAALGALSLGLALCAAPNGILLLLGVTPPLRVPQHLWSLYANFIEYLIVAAFFAAEYAYRRRRFPQQPYANIVDFLRRMLAVAPRELLPGMPARDGERA